MLMDSQLFRFCGIVLAKSIGYVHVRFYFSFHSFFKIYVMSYVCRALGGQLELQEVVARLT